MPYTLGDALGDPCVVNVGGKRFPSRVLGVAQDTVWVQFPVLDYSVVGMPADLELTQAPETPCYHAQIVLASDDADGGAILQRTGMLRPRHRRSWRVPVSFMSKLWQGQSRDTHPIHVLDLSMVGVLVKARVNIQLGSYASMVLALPEERPHTVSCRVIRGIPQSDGTRLYGLAFQDLSPQTARALTLYLWKAIRDRYPEAVKAMYPNGAPRTV